MSDFLSIASHLEELERELLSHPVRVSNRTAELLSDDFVEFGSTGRVYDKKNILASLAAEVENPLSVDASDFKVVRLEQNTALVTYKTHRSSEANVDSLRSSIWQRRNGRWQMLFHQGTKCSLGNEDSR